MEEYRDIETVRIPEYKAANMNRIIGKRPATEPEPMLQRFGNGGLPDVGTITEAPRQQDLAHRIVRDQQSDQRGRSKNRAEHG